MPRPAPGTPIPRVHRLLTERLYRHLFNPELYLRAYGKIYRNDGAMTPGASAETADGMSLRKIQAIIEALRHERYRWTPVRRTYIDKKNSSKKRPLGLPRRVARGISAPGSHRTERKSLPLLRSSHL